MSVVRGHRTEAGVNVSGKGQPLRIIELKIFLVCFGHIFLA